MRDFILHFLSTIDEPFYSILTGIQNFLHTCFSEKEKPVSYGDQNPDKTFYVITNLGGGILCQYDAVLGFLRHARRKGWVPVIDLRKTDNDVFSDPSRPEENPWEYYFEQPSPYTLDEVYRSKNVVHCAHLRMYYTRMNKREMQRRFTLSQKIPFVPEMQRFLQEESAKVLQGLGNNVAAVFYRGTDYNPAPGWDLVGHPVIAGIEQFCDIVGKKLDEWQVSGIFFMTEEQQALDYFVQRFPQAHYVAKERFGSNFKAGVGIPYQQLEHTSRYLNNKLYLLDVYICAQCQYMAGPLTNGFRTALNWNGGSFRDFYVVDLGNR